MYSKLASDFGMAKGTEMSLQNRRGLVQRLGPLNTTDEALQPQDVHQLGILIKSLFERLEEQQQILAYHGLA
ncbi:MAG: hypothetical protein ACRCYS_17515 [Beijerinckiaceae bacterium]